ncbi:MAG: amidohydrolase [Sphingomonas sp.]|nr:amidohydrolase [Sphingomonas sp.]
MAEVDTAEMENSARDYWEDTAYAPGSVIREVDYAANSRGMDPLFTGIKIVDTDAHLTEPPTLFTDRAPAGMRDRLPYVKRNEHGMDRWFIGERDCGSLGGNVIDRDHNKLLGRAGFPRLEQSTAAGHELKPRLQAMDDMGVHAQICYHNSGITQAGMLMTLGDEELALTIIRLFNDYNADCQRESGERLFPLAHVPFWNRAEMEKEARRCIDMGLRGFVLPDTPERMGVPTYLADHWTGFLEMCEATGRPINFHLNTAVDAKKMIWTDLPFEESFTVMSLVFFLGTAGTMANWMVSGRLDRHPKLKIGLTESGAGWVPFALEALEHQFDETLPNTRRTPPRRPMEYFRDQFWCTFWFEKVGPKKLLETIGVDKVMFETDFPHPTSLYPGVQQHLVDVLGAYDFEVQKKVLQDNASALYNLPF